MLGECTTLSALCLRSKGHWGYDDTFLEACREELSIREADLGDLLRVATVDGKLAGVVQLDFEEHDASLEKLFVDPPFIGKGVGAVLLSWALEMARARGATRLVVEADPGAADFYRRLGPWTPAPLLPGL
jgi:GNAT superfamily N-acetyltransferase